MLSMRILQVTHTAKHTDTITNSLGNTNINSNNRIYIPHSVALILILVLVVVIYL